MTGPGLIHPRWPAPPGIRAVSTTRIGGVGAGEFRSLNLGAHVGDTADAVAGNRRLLREACGLAEEPGWLKQVHGTDVVELRPSLPAEPQADAAIAREPGLACVVLTADCLPVLLADMRGEVIGAAHAGWRGLAGGVLEAVVEAMGVAPERLLAWLGPAIGQAAFEVGPEVRERFADADPGAADCFLPGAGDRWHADLPGLARRVLETRGVAAIRASGLCTHADPGRFFSHRRDGRCGRMATLIWMEPSASR